MPTNSSDGAINSRQTPQLHILNKTPPLFQGYAPRCLLAQTVIKQWRRFVMKTKRCSRCKKIKPVEEFRWRSDREQYDAYCRPCNKEYLRKYWQENKSRLKEYHKEKRQTEEHKVKNKVYQRRYYQSEKGIESSAKARAKARANGKWQARVELRKAWLRGDIKRPSACKQCERKCIPEGHHYLGYRKEHWLDVQWLCIRCHRALHRKGVK